jgi:hypothetical protein
MLLGTSEGKLFKEITAVYSENHTKDISKYKINVYLFSKCLAHIITLPLGYEGLLL